MRNTENTEENFVRELLSRDNQGDKLLDQRDLRRGILASLDSCDVYVLQRVVPQIAGGKATLLLRVIARCYQDMERNNTAVWIYHGMLSNGVPQSSKGSVLLSLGRCYQEMGLYMDALSTFYSMPNFHSDPRAHMAVTMCCHQMNVFHYQWAMESARQQSMFFQFESSFFSEGVEEGEDLPELEARTAALNLGEASFFHAARDQTAYSGDEQEIGSIFRRAASIRSTLAPEESTDHNRSFAFR